MPAGRSDTPGSSKKHQATRLRGRTWECIEYLGGGSWVAPENGLLRVQISFLCARFARRNSKDFPPRGGDGKAGTQKREEILFLLNGYSF